MINNDEQFMREAIKEAEKALETGDSLDKLALSSIYHHDMLVLLNEMRKRPLGLTKTGRLQRAEINKLGSLFTHDIYHRNEAGEIMFPIMTEDEVRRLLCLRSLAKIMHLSYHRKGKVHLSKNGLGFLENISPGVQLTHLFLTFVYEFSWSYLHPGTSNRIDVSQVLQKNSLQIFRYLLENGNVPVDVKVFSKNLGTYFDLLDPEEIKDENGDSTWWVRLSIEYTLIRELEFFGIVSTDKIKKYRTSYEITKFTVTDDGRLLLARIFETTWGYRV